MPMMEIRTEMYYGQDLFQKRVKPFILSPLFFLAFILSRMVLPNVFCDTQTFTQQPGRSEGITAC